MYIIGADIGTSAGPEIGYAVNIKNIEINEAYSCFTMSFLKNIHKRDKSH